MQVNETKKAGCLNNAASEQTPNDAGGSIQAIKARLDAQAEIGAVYASANEFGEGLAVVAAVFSVFGWTL